MFWLNCRIECCRLGDYTPFTIYLSISLSIYVCVYIIYHIGA